MSELNLQRNSRIANFPIMFFAVTMGLGGLSLGYKAINEVFEISNFIFEILRFFTLGIFSIISLFYVTKFLKFPQSCKAEFSHPIKINFFAAFPISLLLLSILFKEDGGIFYSAIFCVGVAIQTFLTLYIVSFWIKNNMLIQHSNPAWFIPIVGNLIVILAAKENSQFLWYYFSVGLFFYIVLFSIIFYRIIFHDQLAQKFIPTLFIMIAPPAIAFLDYIKLGGNFDFTAQIFLNLTIFFVLLIFFMFKSFFGLKFFLSWWAFTFPTAAATIAFMKAYELSKEQIFAYLGAGMFSVLSILILIVGFFTIKSIKKGEICIAE